MTNYNLIKLPFLLTGLFLLFSNLLFSKEEDETLNAKVNFILDVANHINKKETSEKTHYIIGLYGQGLEFRKVIRALEKKTQNSKIHSKPVKIKHLIRLSNSDKIDLMILSGDRKIKPSKLEAILGGSDYIVLTENYPFGVSALNYAVNNDNDLIFEIQEKILKNNGYKIDRTLLNSHNRISSLETWKAKLKQAEKVIKYQSDDISNKEEKIQVQKKTIIFQNDEINQKLKIIHYQNLTILISIISLLIISVLLIFLLKTNKKRKKAIEEVRVKNKHILFSLDYAKKLQNALLPKADLLAKTFNDYCILYRPKDIVSGDFYWLEIIENKIYFAVADCTGHGVPGAMMSVICSKALTKAVKERSIFEPAKILDTTVDEISSYFSKSDVTINDGMDISLICIEPSLNKLTYAGANNPLYYFENEELQILKPDKQPVGAYDYRQPFTQQILTLNTTSRIYLFSDGYPDQFGGENNKKFSKKRFRNLLSTMQSNKISEQNDILISALDNWQGNNEQIDDICVIGIDLNLFFH